MTLRKNNVFTAETQRTQSFYKRQLITSALSASLR